MFTVVFLVLAAILFIGAASMLEWEFVEGWTKRVIGEWSSRFQFGGIIATIMNFPIDPAQGLGLWNMMPSHVQKLIPQQYLISIGLAFFVLAWLSKYVKQQQLREKIAKAEQAKKVVDDGQ